MDQQAFEKLCATIDGYRDEMIAMQKAIIPMKPVSPDSGGKGEYEKGQYFEPILKEIFDTVTALPAKDERAEGGVRPNYAAVLKGTDTSRTIWLMAHIDVVPEGDVKLWNTPPFEAVVKDGRIYGRGSEDNNQASVTGIFAAKALKEAGITPTCNVGLLLVADEECGNSFGAEYVLKNHRDLFGKNDVVIVPDAGNSAGDEIEVAEKTTLWLKVTAKGKQAHGAYPSSGINAHRITANIITGMEALREQFPQKDPLFTPEPSCTFEPTMKVQNVGNVNTIPGEDVVFFDCRLLPEVDPAVFQKAFTERAQDIAKRFGGSAQVTVENLMKAAPPTSMNEPIVQSIARAAKQIYGVDAKPAGSGGNTVAQFFRQAGFPCVVYSRIDQTLHGPNEYCIIDNLVNDTKIWAYAYID